MSIKSQISIYMNTTLFKLENELKIDTIERRMTPVSAGLFSALIALIHFYGK